ncbi:hypothetical protein BgAZ_204290 [Babesia gibsoni]|uniref:Uncharacterized protein n=1 Tax=Babesia gibsoni TaxID=33632 RepID=A0AAD8PDM1_BABGI|nr:hypothetical protein BgAZ_204290 [Babesia gibsoni]
MEGFDTDGYISEGGQNVSTDHGYTSYLSKPSASRYRNIKAQTNSKVIHLAKCLLAENTPRMHDEALKISLLLLRSIPPKGYLAEDLFLLVVHLLQSNGQCEKLFLKFLSIAGSTTPYLRPLILVHSARQLASTHQIYEMKHQIQRNCVEWHMEKHQVARYYKWIIKHVDTLCNEKAIYSADYRVELEHVLMTYADLKILPNASMLRLFIESHSDHPDKVRAVLELFISLFPRVHFLRGYRLDHCDGTVNTKDLVRTVHDSNYSSSSILRAVKNKDKFTKREFLLLLLDITVKTLPIIEDLFDKELHRAASIFTSQGTLAMSLRGASVRYYLATAKIIMLKNPHAYAELYQCVKRATGVTLERQYMEGNNPVWWHFKQLPKEV